MMRYISFFTGGGGADIGAMNAGAELVCGYEYIPEIAQWCESQLRHTVHVQDILTLDVSTIQHADFMHFSPPCPSFSRANQNAGETDNDIALAAKICEIIEYHQPKILTLENVWQYRLSQSWTMIANILHKVYPFTWDVKKVNFADLGVPQTRERMIVRALKGTMLPDWPKQERWVGWYEAVEDIIDTFPEGELAQWQIDRLPEELSTMILNSTDSGKEARHIPRMASEPMQTVTTQTKWKVLICGNNATSAVYRDNNEPAQTIRANRTEVSRVVLLEQQTKPVLLEASPAGKREMLYREKSEPSSTLRSGTGSRTQKILYENATVLVVTQRGLARFQSFPDWYELPEKKTLSNTIIGNSVPPLGYEKIARGLIERMKNV